MSNVATVKLQPSASYACRTATLIRIDLGGVITNHPIVAGVLEIRESRTPTSKTKSSRYALREEPSAVFGDRTFRITKPGGAVCYHVCLPGDEREFPVCGCIGYEKGGWCRHIASLLALRAEGHLTAKEESF